MGIVAQGDSLSIKSDISSRFANSLDAVLKKRHAAQDSVQDAPVKERVTVQQKMGAAFRKFGGFVSAKASHAAQDFKMAYMGFMLSRQDRHERQRIEDYTNYLSARGYNVSEISDDEPIIAMNSSAAAEAAVLEKTSDAEVPVKTESDVILERIQAMQKELESLQQQYAQQKAAEEKAVKEKAAESESAEIQQIEQSQKPESKLTAKQRDICKGADIVVRSLLPQMQAHMDLKNDPDASDEDIAASAAAIVNSLKGAGKAAAGISGKNSSKVVSQMEKNAEAIAARDVERAESIMDNMEPAAAVAEAEASR